MKALNILATALALASFAYWLSPLNDYYDSGTTQAAGVDSSSCPPAVAAYSHCAPASLHAAGGARLLPAVERPVAPESDLGGGPKQAAGSTPALAAFQLADYDDSFLPTEAGLIDMTIEAWSQEEFLALTQDEAHDLLALDDTVGFKGPDSMLSIAGPLPTEDDCRIGFRSPRVKEALQEVCLFEVLIVELGSIPSYRRDHWAAQGLQTAIRLRDDAALHLMEVLEEETAFGAWKLWWRLYARWSR